MERFVKSRGLCNMCLFKINNIQTSHVVEKVGFKP